MARATSLSTTYSKKYYFSASSTSSINWIQNKEKEVENRLKHKNMICEKHKDILKEEKIIRPRFVINEKLKLVGCLNNKGSDHFHHLSLSSFVVFHR